MAYPKSAKDALQTGDLSLLEPLTDEELKGIVVTLDGLGEEIQKKCLAILLKREYDRGFNDGYETEYVGDLK